MNRRNTTSSSRISAGKCNSGVRRVIDYFRIQFRAKIRGIVLVEVLNPTRVAPGEGEAQPADVVIYLSMVMET